MLWNGAVATGVATASAHKRGGVGHECSGVRRELHCDGPAANATAVNAVAVGTLSYAGGSAMALERNPRLPASIRWRRRAVSASGDPSMSMGYFSRREEAHQSRKATGPKPMPTCVAIGSSTVADARQSVALGTG